ncbi:hypothetical protein N9B94_00090 [Verrucomicrobia bacterium]|nr:hypothetical protein [Verrucomicrobiota bacterium]
MERFGSGEEKKLTDEQKAALAEIDSVYKSKIAEKELFLNGEMDKAREAGDFDTLDQIETQLKNDRSNLEEKREKKKDEVRNQ